MCKPCHGVTVVIVGQRVAAEKAEGEKNETKKSKVDETHTGGEPRMLCLVEVMLERSVWRGRGAVPSRARPWIAVEAAQRRGSVAGAGGARTSRSSVKTSVHVSTKAEAGAAVVIRPGRKGRWKGGPAVQ